MAAFGANDAMQTLVHGIVDRRWLPVRASFRPLHGGRTSYSAGRLQAIAGDLLNPTWIGNPTNTTMKSNGNITFGADRKSTLISARPILPVRNGVHAEAATVGNCEAARIGETVATRDLGDRALLCFDKFGVYLFKPDRMERRQRRRSAELAEHRSQRSDATARRIRHLLHARWVAGIRPWMYLLAGHRPVPRRTGPFSNGSL